jgi:hypothetical protein
MTTYYLQEGVTDSDRFEVKVLKSHVCLRGPRIFLDDYLHGTKAEPSKLLRTIEAPTWLAARAKLPSYF